MAPDLLPSDYCGFLSLPTELRCHIYEYLLADSQTITISAGYVTVFGNRIQDRARKTDIPGLPLDLAPLTRPHYDASLLQVTKPPEIAIDNVNSIEPGNIVVPAPMALMLTCHLINDELTDYDRGRRQIKAAQAAAAMQEKIATGRQGTVNAMLDVPDQPEGLSLYVSYPYGILVLKSLYPYLVKQATRIHVTGYFKAPQTSEPTSPTQSEDGSDGERLTPSGSFEVTRSFGVTRSGRSFRQCQPSRNSTSTTTRPDATNSARARPYLRLDSSHARRNRDTTTLGSMFPAFSPLTTTLAPNILSQLVRTVLPDHKTKLNLLSARILYPGPDPIGTVWAHEDGPVSRILKNMCGGRIHLRVKRGSLGTGLAFSAIPRPRERIVSTGWETWRDTTRCRDESRYAELDKFLLEA